jgi:hypothetical protein
MTRAAIIALASAAAAWATTARADILSDRVRDGLAAYRRAEYARAVQLFDDAARTESLTREEKVAAYRAAGSARVALDRLVEARRDFERLLTIDPTVELDPRISPRVRAVFEETRARMALRGRAAPVEHRLPELAPSVEPRAPREHEAVSVALAHPGGLARRAVLYYRTPGDTGYSRVETATDGAGRARLTVPGGAVRAPGLEHHAVILDDSGLAIARAGSLVKPLVLPVRARPVPVYRRGWFWGVVGGVAGAAVGVWSAASRARR